jgi:hypothetical protein
MHINRQELISSASRRGRRARRTTGRILVSGLGFGVAYYFDTENGERRRKHLYGALQRAARTIDSVWASEAGDPPPVFTPLLRALEADAEEPSAPTPAPDREPVAAAR